MVVAAISPTSEVQVGVVVQILAVDMGEDCTSRHTP